ncbi:MAG: PspA/IM30 family protein [Rubritepida sp.]|jgi:phage shock protein A|nr:PspA/IM30 family protein [Chromatiaceae bacterium]MCU0889809.1 PspA/IM30 family protein [Rubritepida sp.]
MALITRVSRLFRADVNAVLDRIEEPASLLRQAVLDMEEALARDEERARRLAEAEREQSLRVAELERALGELAEPLELAFGSGREDLARTLIRRRLESEQLQRLAAERQARLARTLAEGKDRLAANRERLAQLRQRVEAIVGEAAAGRNEERAMALIPAVREEDVELAFLREKARRAAS